MSSTTEAAHARSDQGADWSIGIDFGTAFSKAAATRVTQEHGGALREMTPLRLGQVAGCNRPFLVPSSIYLDRSHVHFGAQAVAHLTAADSNDRELARSFKTALGSTDFEGALEFFPRQSVDPDRLFRLRDIIVLYLAYLLALIDVAAAQALGVSAATASSRICFSRPGWLPSRYAASHEAMITLFSEAHVVCTALGDRLLAADGVPYAEARAALDAARESASVFNSLDGGVYEASAVGICHFADANSPKCILVVDVGGGTTDVAGLVRAPNTDNIRVVRTARRTIDVAGDDFDAALLDYLVRKSNARSRRDGTAFWRRLSSHVRELKEEMFDTGRVAFSAGGFKVKCTAREFEGHPSFKAVVRDIAKLYELSLDEVVRSCRRDGIRRVGVVLAGGGSRLPALRRAIMRPRWTGFGVQIVHLPTTPAWGHGLASSSDFDALFAQLSAAFGAAISSSEFARSVQV
ncbi:MAG: Hsp70 family protein [Hyphomonadaceae bacterium]|nr:Hsp70 family protein [Hyphomonadaceae bacterium]